MKDFRKLLEKKTLTKATGLDERSLFFIFERIIKEEYGKQGMLNIKPQYYRENKIYIKTNNENWANELSLGKSNLINRTNQEIGSGEIKDIVVF